MDGNLDVVKTILFGRAFKIRPLMDGNSLFQAVARYPKDLKSDH